MGGGPVGGTPDVIAQGAQHVQRASAAVGHTAPALRSAGSQASGAAGDGRVAAAVERLAAAWSRMSEDVGAQLHAAAQLADNGAKDLATAGGGHR